MISRFFSTDGTINSRLLLSFVFLVLSVNSLIYTLVASTNVLRGDAWRFLDIYYSKWLLGTLTIRDLFSDIHSKPVTAILFVANAELFSLQMKYEAILGVLIKIILGLVFFWMVFRWISIKSGDWLSVLIICFLMLLFFGMNETVEYTWSLVSIDNIGYLFGIVVLVLADKYFQKDTVTLLDSLIVLIFIVLFSIIDSTLSSIFLASLIFTLLPLLMLSRNHRGRAFSVLLMSFSGIVASTMTGIMLGLDNHYSLSMNNVLSISYNFYEYLRLFVYGISVGIIDSSIIKYVLVNIYPAKYVILFGCTMLVFLSMFLFYWKRLWSISIVPMTLVIFLILFIVAAAVFRTDLTEARLWPLYIERYIKGYHFGWLGVISIYLLYFNQAKAQTYTKHIAGFLLFGGIAMQTNATVNAWYNSGNIRKAGADAEELLCEYSRDNTVTVPGFVYGSNFSSNNVQFIKRHKLNIFSDKTLGKRCY